ncbi:MAG TPA: hypothetical protein VGK49_05385 [Ilumatobacteraceae bacterium]
MPTNLEAAQTGDIRLALEQARDTAAQALDLAAQSGAGTVAQLLAQYRATLTDIAEMDAKELPQEESELDRIRREREARNGAAADHPRTARRRKSVDG